MKKQILSATAVILLMAILILGRTTVPVVADPVANEPSQTPDPFTEVFPGVYMYWQWWNQSSTDALGEEPHEPAGDDEGGSGNEDYWYYEVETIDGDSYYILEDGTYNYTLDWSFSNLLVSIIVDPDGSYVTWLSNRGISSEYIWDVMYDFDPSALSGDEVILFSSFYFDTVSYSYYVNANYTWYDEEMNPVDPATVVPHLKSEYAWAASLVGSIEFDESFDYSGFGFDVNEMTVQGNNSQWMEHYFSGMSVFDDRNGNGVMDMVYDTISYDVDGDGVPDWSYQALNETASELQYYFIPSSAEIGRITTPYVNDAGQLEWSVEVVNISGQFYPDMPIFAMDLEASEGMGFSYVEESNPINATLTSLSMTYRFEIKDTSVVLKIDQHIGDFLDPVTGAHIDALEGLGLTIDYYSSFSSYDLTVENSDDYSEEASDDDSPELIVGVDNSTLAAVEFGGTYLWSYDGGNYPVGTAIYPVFVYFVEFDEIEMAEEGLPLGTADWRVSTYYYSSCYANWSGYAITHDPIYAVYPERAPGAVSDYINELLTASSVLIVGGSIAVIAVVVRIAMVRRRE